MSTVRRLLRHTLPPETRLRVALLRRRTRDVASLTRFATERDDPAGWPYEVGSYALPLIDYPGQEHLAAAKRHNQRLMAAAVSGLVVRRGEVFSLWEAAGAPTAERGYMEGAALREGRLTSEVGGATCLLSTVLYNAGLLAGLEVIERYNHSVDTYGDLRYYELGRDATIEYGYRDVRFRNPHAEPVLLDASVDETCVRVAVRARTPRWFRVALEVRGPFEDPDDGMLCVHTFRRIAFASGGICDEDLGVSRYRAMPQQLHALDRDR